MNKNASIAAHHAEIVQLRQTLAKWAELPTLVPKTALKPVAWYRVDTSKREPITVFEVNPHVVNWKQYVWHPVFEVASDYEARMLDILNGMVHNLQPDIGSFLRMIERESSKPLSDVSDFGSYVGVMLRGLGVSCYELEEFKVWCDENLFEGPTPSDKKYMEEQERANARTVENWRAAVAAGTCDVGFNAWQKQVK